MKIHPTAIVDSKAELHESVEVGAYTIIEKDVVIGEGTVIETGARIFAGTKFGKFNKVHHGAVIGVGPQDLGFDPSTPSKTIIGDNNTFKEYSNIHKGTKVDSPTIIGNRNYVMGNAHVGHDCILGDDNILTHGLVLAGHVTVGNKAFISGLVAVHQFCFVGDYAMIAGCSKVVQDVPPFATADGNPCTIIGLNTVGLKRGGFSPETRSAIKNAYKVIYHSGMNYRAALDQLEKESGHPPEVLQIIKFFRDSDRGVMNHR
ncbi:acyl-[acyl-carrier-protein]--UDP-N-acetylglucosamine O-acyltransferase [Leptospira hartskeerlii]|uniref:Acyl-[acyl-carrier-protein]--UDP-N-acetylglucosamine O-acyltransferase n=1 Tax=Leptospira hartskeerlii TaxID=2023177 RepID=A0A2M9X912_9LEPT|nr:acyl-ACP--UDP-N-acetylglucosamine O-acyltransferase [Leptospira hartskeerlii]PJZ24178.1 acyl-[acyl-carrier-protein]--UDP-N-acetylglucosamine O-acyltransferase [Leptospira hartskeerlii]PJZ35172.1 acyl-[acyl-carrier-protein]--UDP-N-acetylglucosamine O-acyltransferase [Leptospira hartskeerlii]